MERWLKIYRGKSLLGYAGLDEGQGPCSPFEPAVGFFEVEWLFQEEEELTQKWIALDKTNNPEDEFALVSKLEEVMAKILAPGVRIYHMDDNIGFDCIDLTIGNGRVCWR